MQPPQVTKAVFTMHTTWDDTGRVSSCRPATFTCKLPCRAGVAQCRTTSCCMWTPPLNQCVQLQRHRTTSYDIVRCRTMSCAVWTPYTQLVTRFLISRLALGLLSYYRFFPNLYLVGHDKIHMHNFFINRFAMNFIWKFTYFHLTWSALLYATFWNLKWRKMAFCRFVTVIVISKFCKCLCIFSTYETLNANKATIMKILCHSVRGLIRTTQNPSLSVTEDDF